MSSDPPPASAPVPPAPETASPVEPPQPDPTKYRIRAYAMAILLAGVFCMGVGQSVVFVVLPPLARDLGLADFQVQFVFMMSAMLWVLMTPRWGRRSDHGGRRRYILLGIGGFVISMVLFASAIRLGLTGAMSGLGLYALILGMRCIYGLIGSAQPAAAQAYIADRTSPENRAKGLAGFSAAFGLGATVGPAFAAFSVAFGPLAPLYGVAALAALAWIGVLLFLPENSPPKDRKQPPPLRYQDSRLRPFLLFGLFGGVINAIPIQMIAFYVIDVYQFANDEVFTKVSIALTFTSVAALFTQLVLVQALSLSPRILMRMGPAVLIFGHGLIALALGYPSLLFAAVLLGIGSGMIVPGFNAAASLSVTAEEQGAASGLSNSAGASGFIIAPVFGAMLYAADPRAPFIATTIAAAALTIYAWRSPGIRALLIR